MAKKKITDLKFDDKNFNKGTQYGKSLMEKSLSKFGAGRSILIDKNNRIIAGNKTTENFGELGLEDVQIVETDGKTLIAVRRNDIDLDTPEGREFALADNQTAKSNIDFDFDYLESELGEDTLEEWGIEIPEEEVLEAEEDDFNEAPPEEPITVLGDLIEIGEHRLLCGDSTDSDQVAKLMNGEKADMVFTDPPYGMSLDVSNSNNLGSKGKWKNKAKNYTSVIGDGEDFTNELIDTIFINFDYVKEVFIWGADYFAELIPNRKAGSWLVWDKRAGVEDMKLTFSEFELCWSKEKHLREVIRITWSGILGTEQEFDHKRHHPTQKPTKLSRWFIQKHSQENQLITDIYLGSGSTMVASHQLKRKCYGMELDPKYCDVIIKRMLKLDGTLTLKVNGVVTDPTEY